MTGRIDRLWAFVANPEPDGPEVVVSVVSGEHGEISPLIAHDPEVVESLIGIAQWVSNERKVEIRMVEYARTDNVRVLEPGEGGLVIMEGDAAVLPPEPDAV